MHFNKVILVGKLNKIVSYKFDASNKDKARLQFTIKVDKYTFTAIAWKDVAIAMKNNIKPGMRIMIIGALCVWDSTIYIKVYKFKVADEEQNNKEDKLLYEF